MIQRGLGPGRTGGAKEAPRIGLCLGDPAGIGYEVGLDATAKLCRSGLPFGCGMLVIGDFGKVAAACERLERRPLIEKISTAKVPPAGHTLLLDSARGEQGSVTLGSPSAAAGRVAMSALELGIECARIGYVDALVYTALDHRSIAAAGLNVPELGDFFSARLGGEGARMDVLLAGPRQRRVWVGRVASPAPLADAPALITREKVVAGLVLMRDLMAAAGIGDIRLALPSLSSHAPTSGHGCPYAAEVLTPAAAEARDLGINVAGPLAADTVFKAAFSGGYNGVLSLYHDQGMIAVKTAAFETAVVLHAGLPLPVVTTAHGSALDIAGRGVACSAATIEAIVLAAELALVGGRAGRMAEVKPWMEA